jgi:rubrerythrin
LPPVRAARVLLRSAAEIEPQLFLEYLYASSSLKDPLAAGIVEDIAVEEMGHLLTVNNLLVAMDGNPYFGRGRDVSHDTNE